MRPITFKQRWVHIIGLSLLITGLNSVKPVHIDDTPFLTYAKEFSQHPLRPYDFDYGSPHLSKANELLNPPVHLYWMALGMAIFSDDLLFIKWWLVPYLLILTYSFAEILKRFAPSYQIPFLWLGLFSPVLLPSFNFMLEIPVWSLGLFAWVCAIHATEKNSFRWSILSAIMLSLALQTKYTAMVTGCAIGLWCLLHKQVIRGLFIVGMGVALAIGWELYLYSIQGSSHFITQFNQRKGGAALRVDRLILPLFSQVAGMVPAIVLLGLHAFGWRSSRLILVTAIYLLGFTSFVFCSSQSPLITKGDGKSALCLSNIVYAVYSILSTYLLILLVRDIHTRWRSSPKYDQICWLFLGGWFLLEIAGYFALSPFPAVRRVMGIIIVFTFGVMRFTELRQPPQFWIPIIVVFQISFALVIYMTDLLDTCACRDQARQITARLNEEYPRNRTIWYANWYGFGYYLRESGCRPLTVNRDRPQVNDLLVMSHEQELEKIIQESGIELEQIGSGYLNSGYPLKVCMGYYGGRTPLESQGDGQYRVGIYRIVRVSE
ncbi:MAG: glycosyltransferase family 39 protein [Gemmataceae bacterium]|jgi:hypothetical protein|nr:glycosyltransferase family 39 protein [Gemmataceae bacterium]